MIGRSFKGKGFYGVFRYVLEEDEPMPTKEAHIIGGNLAGRNAKELSSEVRPYRRMRPDITQPPVWHVPLSFHPDEHLNDAQMQTACDRFLDEMGLDRGHYQHLYVRHHDKAHEHVHVVVNRVSDEGKFFDLHRDRPRVKAATRKLEKELGLRITYEKDEVFREALRQQIAEVAQAHLQLTEFSEHLEAQGITPRFAYREGQLHGITYRCDGIEIQGSTLGNEYSFPGLQRHQGIDYQPERDDPVVKAHYVQRGQPKLTDEALQAQLRQQLAVTAQTHPQLREFCQQLEAQGITLSFSIRRGKLSGLGYHYQGHQINGSHLGEAYTFQGLRQQLGIDYRPERDDPVVKANYGKQRVKDQEMVALTNENATDIRLEQAARSWKREQRERQERQRQSQKRSLDLEL